MEKSHKSWRRLGLHIAIITLVVIVGLLALFASTESVGAEEVWLGQSETVAADCSGWWPTDLMCEGGDKTVGALLISFVVVSGIVFYVRRQQDPDWPL